MNRVSASIPLRSARRVAASLEPSERLASIRRAEGYLRLAVAALASAGSPRAAAYARRALKSAEGAYRHADRMSL